MIRTIGAAILVLSSFAMLGQASASDPLAPVAWMAGGVWHGETKGPDGKTTKIATHFDRVLGGRAIAFATSFDGVQQYQGFLAYDAAKKTVIFSYPSADGSLSTGSVNQQDNSFLWDLQMTEASGAVGHYQVHIHRDGADDYTWSLFAPQNQAWTKLFEIHYHRPQS